MGFCFVDHIVAIEPGRRGTGRFTVPPSVLRFPSGLAIEAIGQLAGWVTMAGTEFRMRPIPALAHKIAVGPALAPGTVVDLSIDIERCDRDLVMYTGSASVGGRVVTELRRCLGPLLHMEEFDDPDVVRRHFAALCAGESPSHDVGNERDWQLPTRPGDCKLGEYWSAELIVPADAAFFADHFPRKPVLPATLLLEAQFAYAVELARQAIAGNPRSANVTQVRELKMRSFVPPGSVLNVGAQVMAARGPTPEIAAYARMGTKQVASARITVATE